jgi:hypothetical protein
VVARGAFGVCRGELPADLTRDEVFVSVIMPSLTAAVLEVRRQAREARAKPPAKPESKPKSKSEQRP